MTYAQDQLDAVNAAVYDFTATVTDPKAGIISAYNFVLGAVSASLVCSMILTSNSLSIYSLASLRFFSMTAPPLHQEFLIAF